MIMNIAEIDRQIAVLKTKRVCVKAHLKHCLLYYNAFIAGACNAYITIKNTFQDRRNALWDDRSAIDALQSTYAEAAIATCIVIDADWKIDTTCCCDTNLIYGNVINTDLFLCKECCFNAKKRPKFEDVFTPNILMQAKQDMRRFIFKL